MHVHLRVFIAFVCLDCFLPHSSSFFGARLACLRPFLVFFSSLSYLVARVSACSGLHSKKDDPGLGKDIPAMSPSRIWFGDSVGASQ